MAEAPPPPVEAIGKPEDITSSSSQAKHIPPSSTVKSSLSNGLPASLTKSGVSIEQTLVRLNKLLSTKPGLDSFLATVNYTLYLLSHISTNPPSLRSLTQLVLRITTILRSKLLRQSKLSIPPPPPPTAPSALSLHLTSLCNLVTETRTTLRLLNLIPISLGLRRLLSKPFNPKTDDALLHYLNITQLLAYTTFQAGENIAYLTDKAILPRSRLLRTNGPAGTGRIWLLACRAWAVAVGLDFVKLARQASLERQRRLEIKAGYASTTKLSTEEEVEMERRWWNALFKAGCWFPVCLHYSTVGGIRGVNKGVIGVLGGLAGWEAAAEAWEGTAA